MNTSPIPLLQPLTAPTPLAALMNRWLVALAPAAALIDPCRPSAALEGLQDVTSGAHFLHGLVVKLIGRLEAGKTLQPLMKHISPSYYRPCLARPMSNAQAGLALAMRSGDLRTGQVYKMVDYTAPYLKKLLARPSPFSHDYATIEAVLKGAQLVAIELDEPEEAGVDSQQARTDALALLQCIVAADVTGIQRQSEQIIQRSYLSIS